MRVARSRGCFCRVSWMKPRYGATGVGRGRRGQPTRSLSAPCTVSACRPSSPAMVPTFQCSPKYRLRIRATITGSITLPSPGIHRPGATAHHAHRLGHARLGLIP